MIIEPRAQHGLARHLIVRIRGEKEDITFETPNVVVYSGISNEGVPGDLFSFATSYKVHDKAPIMFPRADYIIYENKVIKRDNVGIILGQPKDYDNLKDLDIVFTILTRDVSISYRRTLATILRIRELMRDDAILYVSGHFKPESVPLLYYFGVDLVDDTFLINMPRGERIIQRLLKVSKIVRKLIDRRRLRDYLEIVARKSQYNASLLKIGEREHYKELERGYPVLSEEKTLMTVFEEAILRPDVRRFTERIEKYYKPPRTKRVLLLIPCSHKKPYSKSKTHRALKRVLFTVKNKYAVHEVIVTSPLGAVPRELEYVYPAQNYDVPVTGSWSEEEVKLILRLLRSIVKKGNYDAILAHVPEDYEFLSELGDVIFTAPPNRKITDDISLKLLANTLNETLESLEYVTREEYLKESAIGVLSYQFMDAYRNITFDSIRGRDLPNSRLFKGGFQVASFDPRRGYYSLSMHGAMMLARSKMFWVEIDDFVPKGSVFCAGIVDADERIREGDEVVVLHEGELRAVGIARLQGRILKEASRGLGIKVRHHV